MTASKKRQKGTSERKGLRRLVVMMIRPFLTASRPGRVMRMIMTALVATV